MRSDLPKPGTREAGQLGCTCPVIDNNHGRGYRDQSDVFIINQHCPLHGKEKSK